MCEACQVITDELDAVEEIFTKATNRNAQFRRLENDLYTLIANTRDKELKTAYRAILDKLYADELTSIGATEVLEKQIGQPLAVKLQEPVGEWTGTAYKAGVGESASQIGLEVSYDLKDSKAINLLHESNIFWIGEYWDEQSKDIFQEDMNRLFAEGYSKDTLAKAMKTLVDGENQRAMSYFRGFAEHATLRIRNVGNVTGYEKGEIEYAEVVAILDDSTTEICREMNGKLIPVKVMSQIKEKLLAIETIGRDVRDVKDDLKKLVPFWQGKKFAEELDKFFGQDWSGEKLVSRYPNLAMPPYHWRCRTRTVAVV